MPLPFAEEAAGIYLLLMAGLPAEDFVTPSTLLKTGHRAIDDLGPVWDHLATASSAPVFMRRQWARAWLAHLAPQAEPWLLLGGDPPVALWPLALQRKWGVRVLGALGEGVSDYLGPLLASPSPALIAALARHLRAEARHYDLLDLGSLHLPDELRATLCDELGRRGCERVYERCAVVSTELPGWDDYLRGRTRKFRANLKRAERRATSSGAAEVRVEAFSEELFDELVMVEQASWKWDAGTAYLSAPTRREFLRVVLGDPRIPSEIWTCRIAGQLAAFSVVFLGQGVRNYYLPSFCRQHSDAGTLLLREIVRQSFGNGVREVDLLQGDERYKLAWATSERTVYQVARSGSTPVGFAALLAVRMRWKVAEWPWARSLVARIGSLCRRSPAAVQHNARGGMNGRAFRAEHLGAAEVAVGAGDQNH